MTLWPTKPPLWLLFAVAAVYLAGSAFKYRATASEDAEVNGNSSTDSMTTEERRMLK